MADDPKWQESGYSPEKAWGEIKQADSRREAAARVTWKDNLYATGMVGGLALLALLFVACFVWWLLASLGK